MGNFHTPYTDGQNIWTSALLDVPFAALDKGITYLKNVMVSCDGELTYDAATGVFSWTGPIIIYFNRTDGQAVKNSISASSVTLTDGQFAYCNLSETNNATITVAAASITTAAASNYIANALLVLAHRNATSDRLYLSNIWQDLDTINLEQDVTNAASVTINLANGGGAYMVLAVASTAITLSNGRNGRRYRLRLTQDATGSRVVTWTTTVKWAGGSAPTLTTTANKSDWIDLTYSNGAWYGSASLNY